MTKTDTKSSTGQSADNEQWDSSDPNDFGLDRSADIDPDELDAVDIDPKKYIKAYYKGTFVVPHPDRLDKKTEKRFSVAVIVPRQLLDSGFNFHTHFKRSEEETFRERYPDFVKFRQVYFQYAVNLDGSEINDPRTFSIERLKKFCIDQGWRIHFNLYPGLKLRHVVFHFFLREDGINEQKAFYRQQEADLRQHGLKSDLRAAHEMVPKKHRITFEEDEV